MNRNQRRLGRAHQKRYDEKLNRVRNGQAELEEVLPPRSKRHMPKIDKFTTNKCCYVAPTSADFGQITDVNTNDDTYQNLLKEQYGFDPLMPDTVNKLKELRKLLCNNVAKVDGSSQCAADKKQSTLEFAETMDGSQWQNVDNVEDIDKYLGHEKAEDAALYLPENVHISETPRIKIIAKKFSRFKENNIELRKLDEKVVCVEYDVYLGNSPKPREILRAFFSIKPTYGIEENGKDDIPTKDKHSSIKNKFKIASDDLEKLNEKEIEIIDGKIQENKTYLEDLKRILRRKQVIYNKKNKNALDLMSLYEMAKKESPPLDDGFSNTNFLSKAELQEMKDLIIRKCASSLHGINRRTVKNDSERNNLSMGVISQSIVAELWREGSTVVN